MGLNLPPNFFHRLLNFQPFFFQRLMRFGEFTMLSHQGGPLVLVAVRVKVGVLHQGIQLLQTQLSFLHGRLYFLQAVFQGLALLGLTLAQLGFLTALRLAVCAFAPCIGTGFLASFRARLRAAGVTFDDIELAKPDLEDVFIAMMQEAA